MTFGDVLGQVVSSLERAGVPYMVTGSLASSYHGEPRATRDIDIVIDPDRLGLERLIDDLKAAGHYVDRDAALAALAARTEFNAVAGDATKVDFIIRKERPFSIEEFRRRVPADLLGTPAFVATAEDLVVAKLEWAAATGSDRQVRDVAGIVAITEALDADYVERWAATLGLTDAWHAVLAA